MARPKRSRRERFATLGGLEVGRLGIGPSLRRGVVFPATREEWLAYGGDWMRRWPNHSFGWVIENYGIPDDAPQDWRTDPALANEAPDAPGDGLGPSWAATDDNDDGSDDEEDE